MKCLLFELDGTTQMRDIEEPVPVIRLFVHPHFSIFEQEYLSKAVVHAAEYKLVGITRCSPYGEVAFYDRIPNVEEIR